MAITCTVPKNKLNCKYCNTKNSHNTTACIKKQKEGKNKKTSAEDNKPKDNQTKTTSSRTNSKDRKRELSDSFTNYRSSLPAGSLHNSCAQSLLKEEHSDSDTESEEESDTENFKTLPKSVII